MAITARSICSRTNRGSRVVRKTESRTRSVLYVHERRALSLSRSLVLRLSRASPHEVRSLRFPLDALVNVGVRLARRVNSGDGSISSGTGNGNDDSDGSNSNNGSRAVRRQWTRQAASRVHAPSLSLLSRTRRRVVRARAKNPARVDSPNRNGTGTVRPPCRRRSRILLPSPEVSLCLFLLSLVPLFLFVALALFLFLSLVLALSFSPLYVRQMSNARDSEMRQKVQPPSHFSPRYRYRPPHHTTESERKRDTLVECTSERERKGKRQRRERKGSRNAGGRANGRAGGRHWRAWMEERDGQDKIEREPSVTDGDRVRRGWRRAAEPWRGGSKGKGEYDGGKGGGREEEGI